MASKLNSHLPLLLLVAVIFLARPTHAFGAGSYIDGELLG